jgi:uncharacterized protein YndB with AHSA1/START domain
MQNLTELTILEREMITKRVFDAPRELVFEAWTNPDHLRRWWGPQGFTLTVETFDFRPGGVWRYLMHGPDGTDYDNKITYLEIVRPERLVYSHGDDREDEQFRVTVTFAEPDGKTEVTMRSVFSSPEELQFVIREFHADEGAKSTFERLAQHLADLQSQSGE